MIDPFRVLHDYDDFYQNSFCQLNRENISLRTYIKGTNQRSYNSFIFGSSRTLAFKTSDWARSIQENDFNPFVFDASNESIEGIAAKIEYLDRTGAYIQNALIIIDSDVTFINSLENNNGHVYVKHPILSNGNGFKYHLVFFKTYLKSGFFIKYIDYRIFKVKRKYMSNALDPRLINNNKLTNDLYLTEQDAALKNDSLQYYKNLQYIFQNRSEQEVFCDAQITDDKYFILQQINSIFKNHLTNFKIIISPLYDQKKMDSYDMQKLITIFGKENVFDYSGKNKITDNLYNYFENSHYRYKIGRLIIQDIYENNTPQNDIE